MLFEFKYSAHMVTKSADGLELVPCEGAFLSICNCSCSICVLLEGPVLKLCSDGGLSDLLMFVSICPDDGRHHPGSLLSTSRILT